MESKLVSIITPCYNGEKTIGRLMDSILNQTYKKIEFILVDDGSVDNTKKIVKNYEQKFKDMGIIFKYIYQENQGAAAAINAGLKHFSGEFLCWPDADDYLESTSIEDRLNVLINNPEYAVVTSNAYIRDESNLNNARLLVSNITVNVLKDNQFLLLLNDDSIICCGCHMVRTTAFLSVNPNRSIYLSRGGQNWQMLLPIYYKFKRYFLDKPLYNYIIYKASHSHGDDTLDKFLLRYEDHEEILVNTLESIEHIQNVDLSEHKLFVKKKYAFLKMHVSLRYLDYNNFDKEFKNKKKYGLEKRDIIALIRRYIKPLNHLYLKIK